MIFVAGSANLDFVVRAPRIPAPGAKVPTRPLPVPGPGAWPPPCCWPWVTTPMPP